MKKMIGDPLVDKLVEAYVEWREASAVVSDSYRAWATGTSPRNRLAFGRYMSALDAEEQAAEVYAGLVRCVSKLAPGDGPPAESFGGAVWGLAGNDSGS